MGKRSSPDPPNGHPATVDLGMANSSFKRVASAATAVATANGAFPPLPDAPAKVDFDPQAYSHTAEFDVRRRSHKPLAFRRHRNEDVHGSLVIL